MSCKCCCTHGHTAIQEKRNSLLKDYWRIILSALLLFGGFILNATDATFFKGEYVPFIWYLLAYLPVGLPVMREAWESILQKDVFSEFTLMSILLSCHIPGTCCTHISVDDNRGRQLEKDCSIALNNSKNRNKDKP